MKLFLLTTALVSVFARTCDDKCFHEMVSAPMSINTVDFVNAEDWDGKVFRIRSNEKGPMRGKYLGYYPHTSFAHLRSNKRIGWKVIKKADQTFYLQSTYKGRVFLKRKYGYYVTIFAGDLFGGSIHVKKSHPSELMALKTDKENVYYLRAALATAYLSHPVCSKDILFATRPYTEFVFEEVVEEASSDEE